MEDREESLFSFHREGLEKPRDSLQPGQQSCDGDQGRTSPSGMLDPGVPLTPLYPHSHQTLDEM